MYADVVVLTYQAPDIDYFTYKVPTNLNVKPGQLVEVPFGKRQPYGIVIAVSRQPLAISEKTKIKPISKILIGQPILLPYQIELTKWMSSYYLAPMVNCLNAILPELPGRASSLAISHSIQITNVKRPTPNAQSLVLVPTINRIPETLAKFPKAKNYVVYHNELKTSEKFAAWMKIKNGEADYIFGSRMAIFAPCPNLREIIIYDEHDGAYKDERSPYFDTLTVTQKISQLTGAQRKIVDPTPKITTYFQLSNHIKIQPFTQKTMIVNIQNERAGGNKSPISFDLEEEIREVLENKGNVLLFLNRKKENGHMFCKSCKTSQYMEKQPTTCPNCNSPNIFWNALNINSLETEVRKLFLKVNIYPISESVSHGALYVSQQIDIGTAFSLYSPHIKKYDLVAHIQADSLLNLADFTSGEKFFQQIVQLKKLLTKKGKLILQTNNTEHPILKAVEKGDYGSFYQEELKARKLLSYPPYSLLVKLTFKGKSNDKVRQLAQQTYNSLSTNHYPLTAILGPYKSIFWQKIPTYHIILKHKMDDYSIQERQKTVTTIGKYLEKRSKNYTIEVEPDAIQ